MDSRQFLDKLQAGLRQVSSRLQLGFRHTSEKVLDSQIRFSWTSAKFEKDFV